MFGGKRDKVKECSGFMGDTSPEQDEVLAQFKARIEDQQCGDLAAMHYDDYDILRFCRARKFVMDDVWTMWDNFISWRHENDVEDIVEKFEYTEMDEV